MKISQYASGAPIQRTDYTILQRGAANVKMSIADVFNVPGPISIFDAAQSRFAGLQTEVGGSLINLGVNESSANRFGGAYTAADKGGFFRVDSRAAGNLFSWFARSAGSTGAPAEVLYADESGIFGVAKGVQFPATQNPSANPNTCDDYEEGGLSVLVLPGGGAITSYTVPEATYTKNGNSVRYRIVVSITNNGTGNGFVNLACGSALIPAAEAPGAGKNITNNKTLGARAFNNGGALNIIVHLYDGNYPAATGESFTVSGEFRV